MATIRAMPASAASMMASAAKAGGTKIMLQLAPALVHGLLATVLNHGDIVHLLAPLARGDAGNDIGAVGDRIDGCETDPSFARDALYHQPRIFISTNMLTFLLAFVSELLNCG